MVSSEIVDDIIIQFISAKPYRLRMNNSRECNHRNFSGTSPDIHNHVSYRFMYIQANSDGSGHGFIDQIHFLGTRMFSAITDRSPLYFCDSAGYTNHHLPGRGVPLHLHLRSEEHTSELQP